MDRHEQQERKAGGPEQARGEELAQLLAKLERTLSDVIDQVGRAAASAAAPQPAAQRQPPEEEASEREEQTVTLFDPSQASLQGWKMVGAGQMEQENELLQLRAGSDRGLAYFIGRRFGDFMLRVSYQLHDDQAPACVAVRFWDPQEPVPDHEHPEQRHRYDNQAYVAAHTGFEVRLGSSGGEPGTLVGVPIGDEPPSQQHPQSAQLKAEDWNELELEVRGNEYSVRLNGMQTARFRNPDPSRGTPAREGPESGYLGFLIGEQPKPKLTPRTGGPLSPEMAGPVLPPGIAGVRSTQRAQPRPTLSVQRALVITLGPSAPDGRKRAEEQPQTEGQQPAEVQQKQEEAKQPIDRARKDLVAIEEEVRAELARLKSKDAGLEGMLKNAYGYAVLPSIGRASLLVGGARGYGIVFEQGKPVGFTRATQITAGVQVGGQTFTELLFFPSKETLEDFKRSPRAFNGNLSAVFIRGASGTTDFHKVTARAYSRGGMLLEASLGGQKFRFMREEEALQSLTRSHERADKMQATVARAGHAAKGLLEKLSVKARSYLEKRRQHPQHEHAQQPQDGAGAGGGG